MCMQKRGCARATPWQAASPKRALPPLGQAPGEVATHDPSWPAAPQEAKWGQHSLVTAERLLLQAALEDPANAWFVLLSETTVPLYPPTVLWRQLMAETKSRINACWSWVGGGPSHAAHAWRLAGRQAGDAAWRLQKAWAYSCALLAARLCPAPMCCMSECRGGRQGHAVLALPAAGPELGPLDPAVQDAEL